MLIAVAVGAGLVLNGSLASQSPPPVAGLESIRIEELSAKVHYLAADEFRGRGDGTPELDRAAEYIAGVFEENGLDPGTGDDYFQEFTVDRLSLGAGNRLDVAVPGAVESLQFNVGSDFVPFPGSIDGAVSASMLFVGYGIRAPGLGFDDFARDGLENTIAVALDGVPRGNDPDSIFNALTDRDFSSIRDKALAAEEAGAVALLVLQGPLHGASTSIPYLARNLRPNLPPRNSVMRLASSPVDPKIPVAMVSRGAAVRLVANLRSLQADLDAGSRIRNQPIAGMAALEVDFDRDSYTARNVVARIPGTDRTRRDEAIVVGAHYDHDGEDGGQIWNGADDDASGTSALLELAEAFSDGPRPSRSVLLAAWAAEEKGMLGSQFYVRNPIMPLDRTVAMFQLDMLGRNEEHGPDPSEGFVTERGSENGNMMNVIGSVFSPDFRQMVERSNSEVGLELRFRYDYKAQNLIRRSDHWSFLSVRVPALFFFGGLHPDYHTPNDTADKINYEKLEKVVRLTYLAVLEVGDSASRPGFVIPSR